LFAASILRKNPDAEVIPFDTLVRSVHLNPMDSVMTNATKLARDGGGTACSVAMKHINANRGTGSLIIYVSDNESWFDVNTSDSYYSRGTSMAQEWASFKKRNPKAKLVCIDLTPNNTTQVQSDKSVLNVGGFNDRVFDVVRSFQEGKNWVDFVNKVNTNSTSKPEKSDIEEES